MTLGGFNFLEKIREEGDDELEDDDDEEKESCNELNGSGRQHREKDKAIMVVCTGTAEDPMNTDTCRTSFESTCHTRSLSDTSGSEEESHHHRHYQSKQCQAVNELDDVCSLSNSFMQCQRRSSEKERAQRCIRNTKQQGTCRGIWSTTSRFLERLGLPRYQEVPEEARHHNKWFPRRRPTKSPNPRQFVSELFHSTRKANRANTGATKPFRDETISGSTKKAPPRGIHRKTPSGSFASAIGRDE